MDSTYGKLFLRSFSFFFSADFSSHSFLKNAWGRFVYKKIKAQKAVVTTGQNSYK